MSTAFHDRQACLMRYGQKIPLNFQVRGQIETLKSKFQVYIAIAIEVALKDYFLALSSLNQPLSSCFSVFFSSNAVNLQLSGVQASRQATNSYR